VKRFYVGGRILKSTLAVTMAIFFAQQLGLEDRVGLAALVALLTVQRTFYHSLMQSMATLGAVLIGGILGMSLGYFFGITPLAYGVAALVGILLCAKLRWYDQTILTTLTAIGTIFSGASSLGLHSLLQILTALMGGGFALLINYVFNPNYREELTRRLLQIEEDLSRLIDIIIKELQELGCSRDEFKEQAACLKKNIEEGIEIASLIRKEPRFISRRSRPDRYYQVLQMFNLQLYRLEEMYRLARLMPMEMPQAARLARLLSIVRKIQQNKLRGKKTRYARIEYAMDNLDKLFTVLETACSRDEFVSRAALFMMLEELKRYYERTLKLPDIVHNTTLETSPAGEGEAPLIYQP